MPVQGLTKEQIAEATRATITAGGKSTDRNNRLPGETATEANNRITAAYKELTAKPILTQEQIDGGMKVQFVREGAGGVGMYTATKPPTYDGPTKITNFTNGIIPEGTKYATGSAVGLDAGGRTVDEFRKILVGKLVAGNPLTTKEREWLNANPEGSSTSTSTTKTVDPLAGKTPDQIAAYNNAKATAQQFVDLYGGALSDYFDSTTGRVTSPSKDVINKKFAQSPNAKKAVKTTPNGDGTFTITFDDGSTEIQGTKTVNPAVTTDSTVANAALQKQIDDLKAAGLVAEAKRLEDKARYDSEIKAQAAASKLAYDTAAQDKANEIKVERTSAFDTLKAEFEKYGLGSLVDDVKALILNGTPKSQATLKLRATPQYQLRFAGNTQRLAEGKNLYDEGTYLALENDFRASFEAYGQKALLGNTRESAQSVFADFIGGDKSPTEIKDRIRLAVEEVSNRKDIRSEFQKFFPEITDSDLVSYFLKPKETLSALTAKVRVAQIGSAASAQGLNANLTTATDLEQLGLSEQQARAGYKKVATDLPDIEKLGSIDKTNINQTTAENAYLKGLASEQRKIDQAVERERNRFAQSSGMNKVSLTDAKAAGQY